MNKRHGFQEGIYKHINSRTVCPVKITDDDNYIKKKDVGEKHTSNKEAELLNTQNTCIHKHFLKYLKATFVTCV